MIKLAFFWSLAFISKNSFAMLFVPTVLAFVCWTISPCVLSFAMFAMLWDLTLINVAVIVLDFRVGHIASNIGSVLISNVALCIKEHYTSAIVFSILKFALEMIPVWVDNLSLKKISVKYSTLSCLFGISHSFPFSSSRFKTALIYLILEDFSSMKVFQPVFELPDVFAGIRYENSITMKLFFVSIFLPLSNIFDSIVIYLFQCDNIDILFSGKRFVVVVIQSQRMVKVIGKLL